MIVTHMSNDLFKALSSKTRVNMLKTLQKKEMHISGLARELNLTTGFWNCAASGSWL
jgi:predicted transcriptional regulator